MTREPAAAGHMVNGIDMDAFEEALAKVASTEGAHKGAKSSRVRWLGGVKLKCHVRNHTFMVDEPPHLAADDEAPNAVEYVVGALGACYATGLILNASRQGIKLRNLEITVETTQANVFKFLGINDDGHPGIDSVRVKAYVQADADEQTIRKLWERTVETSPVGNTLTREAPITTELSIL
ncbi:MAG: OsmC family protein [Dehalococcoidia bacterium]